MMETLEESTRAETERKNNNINNDDNKNVNKDVNNKHVADNTNTPINVKGMVDNINNKIDPIAGAWGPYNSIRAGNTNVNIPQCNINDKSDDEDDDKDNDKDNNHKSKKGPKAIPFKDLSKPKEWDGTHLNS